MKADTPIPNEIEGLLKYYGGQLDTAWEGCTCIWSCQHYASFGITQGSLFIMNSLFTFCRSSSSTDGWPSLKPFNQLYTSDDLWAWHWTFPDSCLMSSLTQRKSVHVNSTWRLKHVMYNCQASEEMYTIFILCQN